MAAVSAGTGAPTALQGDVANAAYSAASRLSEWTDEVGNELNDYAAAIVLDSGAGPAQLGASFRTLLTGTNDFWLLELTDPAGQVIAASDGIGIDLSGASWLSELSATPLLTPITLTSNASNPIRWFVARRATTGGTYDGYLVGALRASQVANLLSPAAPDVTASAVIQAVLPAGIVLYSSTMTTTVHAGLTDASMVADGALSERVSSPAVTAALAGETGATRYTAHGADTSAGYASVALPGWRMGIMATEPSAPSTGAAMIWVWLLPGVAALAGLALLWGLAASRPRRLTAGAAAGTGAGGPRFAIPLLRRPRRGATPQTTAAENHVPAPAADGSGGAITIVHRDLPNVSGRPSGRRRLRGRYEILGVTGSGGEGQVLRALDHLHSRQVAIKVRGLKAGDLEGRRQILNEASVLLRMTPHAHASVVREDFIIGDRYYLVMDWVEGTPLNRLLAERGSPGLPLETVLEWMEQVAEVLDHLHGQSPPIVHGDVKPSNVIVTSGSGERVTLVDFGISWRRESFTDTPVAPSGRGAVGSPGYMAPEMQGGAPPTPAADIFGLAATTFALLVGEPPRLGRPPDWEALAPGSGPLMEVAFKAGLAVDASRRPRSAGAFIASVLSGNARPVRLRRAAAAGG